MVVVKVGHWFVVDYKGEKVLINKFGIPFGGTPENPQFKWDEDWKFKMTYDDRKEMIRLIEFHTDYKLRYSDNNGKHFDRKGDAVFVNSNGKKL